MSALSDTQNSIVPAGNEVIHDAPEGAAVSSEDVSVAAVVQRVAEIDRDYASLLVPSKQSIKVGAEQITFGDDNYGHSEDGWKHLARRYGASAAYWEQFDPAFKSEIVQYHLQRDEALEPGDGNSILEAVAFQNRFVGFRPTHLVHLDFSKVLHAVLDALGPNGQHFSVNRLELLNHTIFVELTTERLTHNVRLGDTVQGGVSISHSFLGTTPTTVDLYVYRRFCRNGMNLRHCAGHTEISRSRRLKNKSPQSVAAAIEQIQRMVHERLSQQNSLFTSLSQLPEARIEKVGGTEDEESIRRFLLPSLRATHLWSNDLWRRVLAPAWQHVHGGNGELTEFAAVNTITYVATHQRDLSFRQRRTLARLAGLLAFRRVHVCPRCNSAVIGS